jgi:hypothetical protein
MVPPEKLLRFDPDEWPAAEWWQSAEMWGDACMAWVKAYPNGPLGTALDVMRERHLLYQAHRRAEWEASQGGHAS